MIGYGDLQNMVLHIIERWYAGRYTERHALVSSYDPKLYLAKVTLQPEGQETGWLPIETGHIGEGYGITIGLQPGSAGSQQGGQQSASQQQQNQGDQVIIRYQEGDIESGKIVQRVHSDQDKPPETQSGEIIIWTKFQKSGGQTPDSADGGQGGTGQQISLKKDGSLTVTDGNGATYTLDGKGNVNIVCNTFTVKASKNIIMNASQDVGLKGGNNVEVKAGSMLGVDAGSEVVVQGGGDVSSSAVTAPSPQPSMTPFQVP